MYNGPKLDHHSTFFLLHTYIERLQVQILTTNMEQLKDLNFGMLIMALIQGLHSFVEVVSHLQ